MYARVPIIPDPNITKIGLALNLRNTIIPDMNNKNSIILKLDRTIADFSAWNKAKVRIDSPADVIRATTAGRKLLRIV